MLIYLNSSSIVDKDVIHEATLEMKRFELHFNYSSTLYLVKRMGIDIIEPMVNLEKNEAKPLHFEVAHVSKRKQHFSLEGKRASSVSPSMHFCFDITTPGA